MRRERERESRNRWELNVHEIVPLLWRNISCLSINPTKRIASNDCYGATVAFIDKMISLANYFREINARLQRKYDLRVISEK